MILLKMDQGLNPGPAEELAFAMKYGSSYIFIVLVYESVIA